MRTTGSEDDKAGKDDALKERVARLEEKVRVLTEAVKKHRHDSVATWAPIDVL